MKLVSHRYGYWAWLLLCKTLVCFEAFATLDSKVGMFSCQRADSLCLKYGIMKFYSCTFLGNLLQANIRSWTKSLS